MLDHLVVAAASLEAGVAWCEATLGVTPGAGGRHANMGTHNRLLSLADAAFPNAYLEIIAIDPQAPAPGRVRWFGLDDPAQQASWREQPRLIHAVARTTDLDGLRQGLAAAGIDAGQPLAAGRETAQGPLNWRILVRDDGRLLCGGALPTLIEWQGRHPAESMPASGLRLTRLTLRGIGAAARDVLQLRGVAVEPSAPAGIEVELATPGGTVTLRSVAGGVTDP